MARVGALAFLALMVAASPTSAEPLDVEAELAVPKTRLLVVEFFATWCQPCMEAVPRWEALRRRYAKQGLRFVVVAVKDDADRCADVPWHPDRILCDSDGALAERLGVKALPSAFLWSWQGHLLARGSHVDAVEASIDAWMREIPRVEIRAEVEGARAGVDAPTLRGLIAAELGVTGQLVVVASPEERKELRALARSSFAAAVDERYRCPLGKEVSANNLLQATVAHGRLRLGLLSAETHCRNGDVYSSWDPTRPEASVTRGVTKLLAGLQRRSPEGLALATRIVAPESQPEEVPAAPTPKPTPGSLGALLAEAEGRVKDAERPARERRAAEDKRREAERAALQRAWAKLDKLAFKSVLPRAERAELLTRFADNYPADHPHVISARRFLAFLEAGYEPRRDMVFVPGGTAVLGCKTPDRCDDYQEMKTTKIRVRPFFIDRTEVTVEAYDQCVRVGFCGSPAGLVDELECNSAQRDRGQHPVNCVSWTDAVAYCSYRRKTLPTEVQWEKAARGLDRRPYPWGDSPPSCDLAVMGGEQCARSATAPVGSRPAGASPYGALDMAGNVAEWMSNHHRETLTPYLRGGSWVSRNPDKLKASWRSKGPRGLKSSYVGFRCAELAPKAPTGPRSAAVD